MTEPNGREHDGHPHGLAAAWAAVTLAQAMAMGPPDAGEIDSGWQLMHWRPGRAPEHADPRGAAVGALARRLIALERARLLRRQPPRPPWRRLPGVRAG